MFVPNMIVPMPARDLFPGVELDDFGCWRNVVSVYRREQGDGTVSVEASFGLICRCLNGDDAIRVRMAPDVFRRWETQCEADAWYAREVERMRERAPA